MPWEYAVIVAVFVTGLVAAFCAGYGRTQKRKRHRTQNELELTERLLGDVQDENERVTEEIADMEQAWVIRQADLKFGEVIGEGAYGSVFRGTWGYDKDNPSSHFRFPAAYTDVVHPQAHSRGDQGSSTAP